MIVDRADETVTTIAWSLHHCIGDGASLSTALLRLNDNKGELDDRVRREHQPPQQQTGGGATLTTSLRQKLAEVVRVLSLVAWSAFVIAKK